MSDLPLVTCLCLTHDRPQYLPIAIKCFLNQTYPNKELLIVWSGSNMPIIHPMTVPPLITTVQVEGNIGAKRNAGCKLARNADIICHWDDDDYSCAHRIEDQVGRLLLSGKSVTGYYTMKFLDEATGKFHEIAKGRSTHEAMGTSLCYLRSWWLLHPFKPIPVNEDIDFVLEAARLEQITCVPANDMMFARNHPGNTSKRPNMARFPLTEGVAFD